MEWREQGGGSAHHAWVFNVGLGNVSDLGEGDARYCGLEGAGERARRCNSAGQHLEYCQSCSRIATFALDIPRGCIELPAVGLPSNGR